MIGIVFSQRDWTRAGDLDDCWVLSSLQAVNCAAPWLYLPAVPGFRKAAGDPDDGHRDGGSINEIVKGVTTLYPEFTGKLKAMRGVTMQALGSSLRAGHPVSVALMQAKLPKELQCGSSNDVAHQCTLRSTSNGHLQFANPMVPHTGTRWADIELAQVRPAILAYGNGTVFGVEFPTAATMAPTYPPVSSIIDAEAEKRAAGLVKQAELRGYQQAKQQAIAACEAIKPTA